jgi:Cd2+/Zn2+-exporting ATPase
MDCADEVAILRREIVPLIGSADRLGFDILRGKMLVAPGTPVITADQIVRVVGRTGMRAEPWQDVRPGAAEAGFWQRRGRTVLTALSGTFLISGFLAHVAHAGLIAALGSEGAGLAAPVPPIALIFYVAGNGARPG